MTAIAAAIIVFYFGFVPAGIEMAKNLLTDSPVLFYALMVPLASIFAAWTITRIRKAVK